MRKEVFLVLNVGDRREAPIKMELNDDVNNRGRIMDDEMRKHEM